MAKIDEMHPKTGRTLKEDDSVINLADVIEGLEAAIGDKEESPEAHTLLDRLKDVQESLKDDSVKGLLKSIGDSDDEANLLDRIGDKVESPEEHSVLARLKTIVDKLESVIENESFKVQQSEDVAIKYKQGYALGQEITVSEASAVEITTDTNDKFLLEIEANIPDGEEVTIPAGTYENGIDFVNAIVSGLTNIGRDDYVAVEWEGNDEGRIRFTSKDTGVHSYVHISEPVAESALADMGYDDPNEIEEKHGQGTLVDVWDMLDQIYYTQTSGEQKVQQSGNFNEKSLDTFEYLKRDRKLLKYPDSPGGDVLLNGDRQAGFYGFVSPEEFGKIENNPEGSKDFNGDNLTLALGITQGTSQFSDTPWMKFISAGKVLYVPVKPIRRSISWNAIYDAGAVYGDDTVGTLPPNGRCGPELSIDGENNKLEITIEGYEDGDGFLHSSATIGEVEDTLVLAGWDEEGNDGEYEILSISDTEITLDGDLTTESGTRECRIWNKADEVLQNAQETIGGRDYRIRLLRGAADDPTDSYGDGDRGSIGKENEWNRLILPIHERAKEGDWNYSSYAGDVDDWRVGLSDADLITHNIFGNGSYSWCQEARENSETYRRVLRGYLGVSFLLATFSWNTISNYGLRPGLELL